MIIYKFFSLFCYPFALLTFIIAAIFIILFSFVSTTLFYFSIKFFCRCVLLSFFIWPNIYGSFPKKGNYIIMMNHSSFIDVFLFPLIPRGPWSGITARENFKYPIFSHILKRLNAIPIDRKNKSLAIQSINIAESVLNSNIHIGILPEGSRTVTGKMLPLKKGGFHMAKNTNTAIIPVGICGAYNYKPKNRWWLKPGKISIKIGEAIKPIQYNNINDLLNATKLQLIKLSKEHNES